jgi:signal transduction histidine kinase
VLNEIRSQLYLSATYVRDYLLEAEPSDAEMHRASLQMIQAQIDSELQLLGRELEPEQTRYYSELSREIANYWQVLAPTFTWDAHRLQREGLAFVRNQVSPRRTAMLSIADRIASIDDQQLDAGNRRVNHLLSEFQIRLAVILSATFLLGLGMAAFSTRKILRLDAQAQARYQEVVEARRNLKALSAQLVNAQESERRALSRELHDEVGQALSAVLMELHNFSAEPATQADPQARDHVETIKTLVENSVRVIRNMSLLLRPSMLDDLGVVPALRWYAREVSKRTSMDVSVATELVAEELSDEDKTCIYRVVQEALTNCSRHAGATKVRIRVQQETSRLVFSIQDDGKGFDVKQTKGLGLLGIEERVAKLGGKCQIQSAPGSGTTVAVELPFNKNGGSRDGRGNEKDSNPLGG